MPKGQQPKPSDVKKSEGNRSKLARDKVKEDPRGVGEPTVPMHLSSEERLMWGHVIASLPEGLLTRADDMAIEGFVVNAVRFRRAHQMIEKTGYMIQSPQGPVRNPLLVVQNNAHKLFHMAGSELGLTPVSRARLATPGEGEDDPMALLLGGDFDPTGLSPSKLRN